MVRLRRAAPIAFGLAIAAACAPPTVDGTGGGGKGTTKKPDNTGVDGGASVHTQSKSCTGGPGADKTCGGSDQTAGSTDCCEARAVPGGTYNRFNDADFPATVSKFALDTFEVTAGRFRAWVEATDGNLRGAAPSEGAGAHPKISGSGWRSEWNQYLPSSRDEVDRMFGPEDGPGEFMACQFGTTIGDSGALTWWTEKLDQKVKSLNRGKSAILAENSKDALDRKPINCIPWHVLFAFCVWDGGRLPTDAEFGFAVAGGDEQRPFPWGTVDARNLAYVDDNKNLSQPPIFEYGQKYAIARLYDHTLGDNIFEDNYSFTFGGIAMGVSDNAAHIAAVGRKPLGNGKWGHADLAGGMWEWMLDEGPIRTGQCKDCANVNWPKGKAKDPDAFMEQKEFGNPGGIDWWQGGARAIRGGAWDNAQGFATSQQKNEIEWFTSYPVLRTYRSLGGRCARDL